MTTKRKTGLKGYQVPAVKRAFAILDSLNESSTGLTVQEVSRIHQMPYSTAFYLLETMQQCGYVQRDEASKKYTVGFKLLAFRESAAARHALSLRALASPLMEELTAASGLTCHLATLERDEAVYIEKTDPSGFIRLNTWVGKRNSLHSTAVGKALLMPLEESRVRDILGPAPLPRKTDRTITELPMLLEDLRRSRERGFALDDSEDEMDGCCIAAPILDANGEVMASIGLSGLLSQIDARRREGIGKLVRNYARQISFRLGWTEEREPVPADPAVVG